jgi:hypothetical protein
VERMFNPTRLLVPALAAVTAATGSYLLLSGDQQPAPTAAKTVTMDHSQRASMADMKPDSNAPEGAKAHWLPKDAWVMQHFLPFDEARLYELLKVTRKDVRKHLKTHGNTLAQLAAQHGYADQDKLVADLLGERANPTLTARTKDVLTQSHLSQHVLFHVFHDPKIAKHAQTLFGVSKKELRKERKAGKTPLEIAKEPTKLESRVKTLLEDAYDDAVERGDTTATQAKTMLAVQMKTFDKWKDKVAKQARAK